MKQHTVDGEYRQLVVNLLRQSPLFSALDPASIDKVIGFARLIEFDSNEVLMHEGSRAESFFMILMGEAAVFVNDVANGEPVEVTRLRTGEITGETALLMEHPRTASVVATKSTYVVEFDQRAFNYMLERLPGFARRLATSLASRLTAVSRKMPMPEISREMLGVPDRNLVEMLPADLIRADRVIVLDRNETWVTVGYVDRPTPDLLERVRGFLQGLRVQSVRIAARDFDDILDALGMSRRAKADSVGGNAVSETEPARETSSVAAVPALKKRQRSQTSVVATTIEVEKLEPLLRRMVELGASDLHISAGQSPRWRIDGDLLPIPEVGVPEEHEVLGILRRLLSDRAMDEFEEHHDCDFAFRFEDFARFRVNMFRDERGVGAVFRTVPMVIPTMDQVGLPKGAQRLTELNQGLVLVCGPTGQGKSTTLGAMIDHINSTRKTHIITIEDPVEFIHESKMGMVNQREVGRNTSSFSRALRSALREDPDILLVGELRDLETMELAMETAQTGHLVFSTLHTNSAISTIDRIIDIFPMEQQNQVRSTLADVLRGVINQTLCRRVGGGRVAAFETLVCNSAVANCIRTAKNVQIQTIMATNKAAGNCLMNDDLESLVRNGAITPQEAIMRSTDRKDMRSKLGMGGGPAQL
jgi:pilus retraction protein PilT